MSQKMVGDLEEAEDGPAHSEMLFSGYDMAAAPTNSQQLGLFAQDRCGSPLCVLLVLVNE